MSFCSVKPQRPRWLGFVTISSSCLIHAAVHAAQELEHVKVFIYIGWQRHNGFTMSNVNLCIKFDKMI